MFLYSKEQKVDYHGWPSSRSKNKESIDSSKTSRPIIGSRANEEEIDNGKFEKFYYN